LSHLDWYKLSRAIHVPVERVFALDLPRVTANDIELNQVWTNLIDNAVDAMNNKGVLTIRTTRNADSVIVEIGDNGPGIPKNLQSHIFERFFTTKPVGQGTGLALAAARRIVRKLKGRIFFASVPGDTRFQVRIPIAGKAE
jgi:signal transduction histidine kinase